YVTPLLRFFLSSRRRHTRSKRDWSSDVCSSDPILGGGGQVFAAPDHMGDAHQVVVHHVGKVIGGQPVPLQQDLVVQGAVLHGDLPEGDVGEGEIGRAHV